MSPDRQILGDPVSLPVYIAAQRISPLTCALLASTAAVAATDLETFQRRVGKSPGNATDHPDRPKGTCLCLSSLVTPIVGKAGVLRQFPFFSSADRQRVGVECWVPVFNAAGSDVGFSACSDFTVLPK